MADIIFRPKYNVKLWIIFVLLMIHAVLVLGVGVMILLSSARQPLIAEEGILMVSFFVMFVLIVLCSLNLVIRKIVIASGGIAVTTLLGTVSRRPFSVNIYYEQGCFIIGKYVMANRFVKNSGELDGTFKKLSAKGVIKYKREKEVLSAKPLGIRIVVFICACLLGIFFAISLGMLKMWVNVAAIDVVFLGWFIISFNKLPKAGREIMKQLSVYYN